MPDATTELNLLLTAKDQASKELDGLKKNVGGLGKTLGDVGKIASGVFLGQAGLDTMSAGINKVTSFLGDSISAAKESKAVNAQLDAVLKSTGGAAGLAAGEIRNMAAALEKQSLFEDEAIINGQNLLLTFTNIGKDVFPQATQTILDMSQALGQDMKSSAVQLGKALNDPINGVTALSRVGVSFTEQQKEQIKAMQEAGDMAGAQQLILAELAKEFGGSAKAASDAAGAQEVYKDKMNDLKEQIGEQLLPIQMKWMELQAAVVSVISEKVIPVLDNFIKYIRVVVSDGDTMNDFLANLPEPIRGVAKAVGETVLFIQEHWPLISEVFNIWWTHVRTVLENFFLMLETTVANVVDMVQLILAIFRGDWDRAWEEAKDIAGRSIDALVKYVKNSIGDLPAAFYKVGRESGAELSRGLAETAGGYLRLITNPGATIGEAIGDKFRANGGPVTAGQGYIVGERGPELFVPGQSGNIVPNDKLGGGAVTVNYYHNGDVNTGQDVMSHGRDIGFSLALRGAA